MSYTVAVDFDGVIHSYTTPWIDHETTPDPPVPGAIEWLNGIVDHFTLVIHTTRGATAGGREAVLRYLREAGYKGPTPEVTNQKVPALVYIDDRGWRFEGTFPTRHEIHAARPWNKPRPQVKPDPPCSGSGFAHRAHGDCPGYTYDRT